MFNISDYEDFYKLKTIKRKGWLDNNLPEHGIRSESDAEHIFSVMFMALNIIENKKLKLDKNKVLKMLLFHEVGECEIGDITPFDGITREQKHEMEKVAVKNFATKHNMPDVYTLWCEFEDRVSPEAKFCFAMDKLDAVVQSKIYSDIMVDGSLFKQFYNNTSKRVENFGEFDFVFEDQNEMFNVDQYKDLYKLKTILRKGWLNRKVNENGERVESDAEHIVSAMFMAANIMENKNLNLNRDKVLFMLLCHEVGECAVGDITPFDGITVKEKHELENVAVKNFAVKHNMPSVYTTWCEFEERVSPEAKFCYAIDKLDAVMQAKMYDEKLGRRSLFTDFYNYEQKRLENFSEFEFMFSENATKTTEKSASLRVKPKK